MTLGRRARHASPTLLSPADSIASGSPELEEGQEAERYLQFVKKHALVIAVVALVVVGSTLFFSYRQTPIYTAEARVLVEPVAALGESQGDSVNLATESELVRSVPVAEIVAEDLGVDLDPQALLGPLDVVPRPGAEVLSIAYSSSDPRRAAEISNAFAAGYLEFRQQQAVDTLLAVREPIEKEVRQVSADLERLEGDIQDAQEQGDPVGAALEQERNILIARLGVLQQRLSDLDPAKAITLGGGRLIEPARAPLSPTSPNHIRNGVLGVILGLGLGLGLALVRDRFDTRFRSRWDIIRATRAPILTTVPQYRSKKTQGTHPIVLSHPADAASESYRNLRTAVQFIRNQRGINSFLITSPLAGEGKTATTVNLGLIMAQAGIRVVLISCDLRKPTLHEYFGLSNSNGLSNWLMSPRSEHWPTIQDPGLANLRIITSGPVPSNPAELLASSRMEKLLRELESESDMVLIDSPPALAVADSIILGERAGATILILNAETPKPAAVHARDHLERVGANIVGTVLNAFETEAASYYTSYGYKDEGGTVVGGVPPGQRSASSK